MKSKLKGLEPAHVVPADVEKQIKELMVKLVLLVCLRVLGIATRGDF